MQQSDSTAKDKIDKSKSSDPSKKEINEVKTPKIKKNPSNPSQKVVNETTIPKIKTNDELFAEAKSISDYLKLANSGYKKAYAPLAELYLENKQYSLADDYAQKAYISGVLVSRATEVMKILQLYGYYDDKQLPKGLEH